MSGSIIVVLCTLVFVGTFLQRSMRQQMLDQLRESLQQQITTVDEVVTTQLSPDASIREFDTLAERVGQRLHARLTFIDLDGRVLGDTMVPAGNVPQMENHGSRPEVIDALAKGWGWSLRRSVTLGEDLLYVAGVHKNNNKPELVIRMALSVEQIDMALAGINRLILWASMLGIVLSLCVALLVARRISHPVKDLTRAALNIAAGDLTQRLRRYLQP